ncbi:AAA family ATPase [Mucilaginibacter sp. HMF7410]|uniref:AAA family ATPase n=2 Tax=Mucilaginibacter arboris TaxID=2682090 RepID=A0A7K1SU44_9SPHI|nr:AAA family ATPase [Mucilaginibacter arboris]
MQQNPQLELANNFVQHTNRNIFLTGKAGTGKTTFLHQLKKTSHKRMAVVAPTGVAAINAGGVTIHSLFQLPFGPYIPQQENTDRNSQYKKQFNREKINLIRSLDLLVIDEISMVRADVLDAIDDVLRRYRNRSKPFGGVQLLMIGDLHQLSPIANKEELQLLKPYYDTLYFFASKALQQTPLVNIELKHIYRQADTAFIGLLNAVRENRISKQILEDLNRRFVPHFKTNEAEGYITLTTHNNSAQRLNDQKLAEIKETTYHFKAVVQGDFPEYAYPTVADLELKVGAQVMFVKNDSSRDKLFYNGKIGKVVRIADEVIYIKCAGEQDEIGVGPMVWQNIKYALNTATKEVQENVIGSFTQHPLRLAWAITIHKSQGLTFEKAIIDAEDAFTHGQVYVALSRCKTLEGMVLSSPLKSKSVITDSTIAAYTSESERNEPNENILNEAKKTFQETLLRELFDFNLMKFKYFSLLKSAEENDQALVGNFAQTLHEIKAAAEKEIYAVAQKFQTELNQLLQQPELPENHEALQERVKKASTYFASKLEQMLFLPLKKMAVETDNKAIRKSVQGALTGLKQEVTVKLYIIKQAAINGFNALAYLQNKANAAIDLSTAEDKTSASSQNQTAAAVVNVDHPELFTTLRNWRNQVADEKNIPPFHIFSQKVLTEMVTLLPSTLAELESIKGMGPVKVKQYGEEILKLINAYSEEKQIQRQRIDLNVPKENVTSETKQVSFGLFRAGKTIAEIAAERNLTAGTIEGHLLHFVALGELEISQVFSQDVVAQISNYLSKNQPESLTEAKNALGDAVSYNALRAVLKHLNYQYPQRADG